MCGMVVRYGIAWHGVHSTTTCGEALWLCECVGEERWGGVAWVGVVPAYGMSNVVLG